MPLTVSPLQRDSRSPNRLQTARYRCRLRATCRPSQSISLPTRSTPRARTRAARGSSGERPDGLRLGAAGVLGEVQSARVDAVAQPGWIRAVVEHVPEMASAAAAQDLGAPHPEAAVLADLDVLRHGRLVEARPPGAGI